MAFIVVQRDDRRMLFAGFPDAAITFYEGLEADNSKSYWTDHKAEYDECVKAPMEALLDELEPEFGEGKVFRPYRDVRFSGDKTPYKTHQGAFVGNDLGSGYYVEISARGLLAGGGFHAHGPDQTKRMREAIDGPAGAELERVVADLGAAGYDLIGERVATAPRGYAKDHPRIDLLRHKELMVLERFGDPAWISTRRARSKVEEVWRRITPLNDWLAAHVGASTVERARR
jgi:uncharacterized protein (TIGR02453 family)